MPDVLNRVTRSGVVVKSWSCELLKELALQDLFGERGVEDSGSDLFWSALDLQFSLLDPSYDQLVEGTDVWRFFNFFSCLPLISWCSETRRIGLAIGVVFIEGDVSLDRLKFVMGPSVWVSSILGLLLGCVSSWALYVVIYHRSNNREIRSWRLSSESRSIEDLPLVSNWK